MGQSYQEDPQQHQQRQLQSQQPGPLSQQTIKFDNKLPLRKDSRVWHGLWNIPFGPALVFILNFPFVLDTAVNGYESLGGFQAIFYLPLVCFALTTLCAFIILLSYPRSSVHYKVDFETWVLAPSNRPWRWINLLVQAIGCVMHFVVTFVAWVAIFAIYVNEFNSRSEAPHIDDQDWVPIRGEGYLYIFILSIWSLIGVHIGFFASWKEAQSLFCGDYKHGDENNDILPGGKVIVPESVVNNIEL
jgi:hypothetical protein